MDWKARFEGGIRLEIGGSWQKKRPGGTNQAYWGFDLWSPGPGRSLLL